MDRFAFIKLLNKYNPSLPDEILFKERMLSFAQLYENCFDRSLTIGHFTGSAWLVNKENSKLY